MGVDDEAYVKIGNEDGVGPVEHVILHGARLLMKDANETGEWDQPPGLWAVTQAPMLVDLDNLPEEIPEDLREEIASGAVGQRLGFSPLEISDQVWTMAPPATVLSRLARYAVKHPPRLETALEGEERIIGLLFMSEAWMVAGPVGPVDDDDDVREAGARGELHKHPDRIEIRLVYGVDRAGYQYAIRQARGHDELSESVQGPGIDPGPQGHLEGHIPDAMVELLAVLAPEDTL